MAERLVDCVAYSAIEVYDRPVGDPGAKKIGEVWASCSHPDREGPVCGCLLVDFEMGEPIEGATCLHQTPIGTDKARELLERMSEIEIPF